MPDTLLGRMPRLVLIPALAALLAGCGDMFADDSAGDADYAAVCTDPRTEMRVDDAQCAGAPEQYAGSNGLDSGSSFVWFYMPTGGGYSAPPVGQRVTAGSGQYTTPTAPGGGKAPVVARSGAVPSGGGAVQRGGLGVGGAKAGGSGGSSGS